MLGIECFVASRFSSLVDARVDQFSCKTNSNNLHMILGIWELVRAFSDLWSRLGSACCMVVLGFRCVVGSRSLLFVDASLEEFIYKTNTQVVYMNISIQHSLCTVCDEWSRLG